MPLFHVLLISFNQSVFNEFAAKSGDHSRITSSDLKALLLSLGSDVSKDELMEAEAALGLGGVSNKGVDFNEFKKW